jgi:hypothetical protein
MAAILAQPICVRLAHIIVVPQTKNNLQLCVNNVGLIVAAFFFAKILLQMYS